VVCGAVGLLGRYSASGLDVDIALTELLRRPDGLLLLHRRNRRLFIPGPGYLLTDAADGGGDVSGRLARACDLLGLLGLRRCVGRRRGHVTPDLLAHLALDPLLGHPLGLLLRHGAVGLLGCHGASGLDVDLGRHPLRRRPRHLLVVGLDRCPA